MNMGCYLYAEIALGVLEDQLLQRQFLATPIQQQQRNLHHKWDAHVYQHILALPCYELLN
jgi:hypothetical protein